MKKREKYNPYARLGIVIFVLVLLNGLQAGGVAQAEGLAKPVLMGDSLSNQYVSAGMSHSCGWKDDGRIVCWGYDGVGQVSGHLGATGFTQVSAGMGHTCGLKNDGSILCWGNNIDGQVTGNPGTTNFTQVSAGGGHTCGLRNDYRIVCWGSDGDDQISDNPDTPNFTQVSAGGFHTCGLQNDGLVYCWGSNYFGQVWGNPFTRDFTQVSAGMFHTCGLKSDSSIVCWGSDGYGQVSGHLGATGFTQVSAGGYHTCGLKSDGSIVCWGAGTTNTVLPHVGQSIVPVPNSSFTQVSTGWFHTCGLKSDGSIVCWGYDLFGQSTVPTPNINFGMVPPTVLSINSFPETSDGQLTDGESTSQRFTMLMVTFHENVVADGSPNAANFAGNYLLYHDGDDGFQTINCAGSVDPGDVNIPISAITFDNNGGLGPYIATLTINGGVPIQSGNYRFLVCGSTSVEDASGLPLNGGVDEVLNFTIATVQEEEALPDTGFAPGVVSVLPIQPEEKAYTDLGDLWLEIPKLDVAVPIVGVPKVDGEWDVGWLTSEAGWLHGSAYPTTAGNTVLTAHVWDAYDNPGPFLNIKKLVHGDRILIHSYGTVYTYEVRYNYIVRPDNPYVMRHEEYDWVTLLTCERYNPDLDIYSYRRVVRAVLVGTAAE